MKRIMTVVVALAALAPLAGAQGEPITKRAVNGNTVQATALTARTSSSAPVEKKFFVAYGGEVFVYFSMRSDGAHQADVKAIFNGQELCGASTSSATYQSGSGCGATIPAGSVVSVVLVPNGAPAGICCVRLKFNLVDVNTPGVTLQN